jgi:GMP synthase-like glutamine amidotransferase
MKSGPKSILVLRHVAFEGQGRMAPYWERRGVRIHEWIATTGESIPALNSHSGLIVMGGPMGADDEAIFPWMASEKRLLESALKQDLPILGFCLGAQLLARVLGAQVSPMGHKEIGWWPLEKESDAESLDMLKTFPDRFTGFHWHGDAFELPPGARRVFRSEGCSEQGFVWGDRAWGFQFHPEIGVEEANILISHCGHELEEKGRWVANAEAISNPNAEWVAA